MPRDNTGDLLYAGSPYAQYQRVDITFPSTANQDTVVRHSLRPTSPDDVEYHVVSQDRAGSVYNDHASTRKVWGDGFIIVRSSVASLKATLLLTVPRAS